MLRSKNMFPFPFPLPLSPALKSIPSNTEKVSYAGESLKKTELQTAAMTAVSCLVSVTTNLLSQIN